MCVYSMILDHERDYLPKKYPSLPWDKIWPVSPTAPQPSPYVPTNPIPVPVFVPPAQVTKDDLDALKKEIETSHKRDLDLLKKDLEELKDLVKRAIKYDEDNGEPDCEVDEKVELIRKLAQIVGVDLSEILEQHPKITD